MQLPEMTPLQFTLVHLLFDGPKTGQELRFELQRRGMSRTPTAFSRLMQRLRASAFVHRDTLIETVDGRTIRRRTYRVTDLGLIVWTTTRQFYAHFPPAPLDAETVPTTIGQFAAYGPKERKALAQKDLTDTMMKTFRRLHQNPQL